MKENIEVSLERIQKIIESYNEKEFMTAEVIRDYSGGFYSNKDTPAYYSFNAQFGKLLKRNELSLRIVEVQSDVRTKDDNGYPTSTSVWRQIS
ncbi:hypothetical protein [Photobacterium satsumensis]|uniref:hypothetical protein n=1 Tax=Photobacterium satsumensis TaxID=2910239 RepID=UPI003D095AB4